MIVIYDEKADDFSGNGLGTLAPTLCTVTETLNGEYELELEHPYDEYEKWKRLAIGRIIRVPVPAATTPAVSEGTGSLQTSRDIYRVSGITQKYNERLSLRTGPSGSATVIRAYANGTEVAMLNAHAGNNYAEVVVLADGNRGYMYKGNLTFVRTESAASPEAEKKNEVHKLRDQPFRIYCVTNSLDSVTVKARHVFYDLLDNLVSKDYTPSESDIGSTVVAGIAANCLTPHKFTFYSDLTGVADLTENADALKKFANANPVEALMGSEGVCTLFKGEILRDWFDVYVVNRVGREAPNTIRYSKNLVGFTCETDVTNVVTRIIPVGKTSNDQPLYLPETYIDSLNIDRYPQPKWKYLEVSDAKVKSGTTTEQCYQKMRDAVDIEYSKNKVDEPTVTVTVDFVDLVATEEYQDYAFLQSVYIGDQVKVSVPHLDLNVTQRVVSYTYNCLTRQYDAVTLGKDLMTLAINE